MQKDNCSELANNINNYNLQKQYQREATSLYIWGAIYIILGLTGRETIDYLFLMFGFILIVIATFIKDKINPRWLLVESILFFTLATTNVISIILIESSILFNVIFAFIGISQFSLGYTYIKKAKLYSDPSFSELSREQFENIQSLEREIKKSKKHDPGYIDFIITNSLKYDQCKGKLEDNYAVLCTKQSSLIFAEKKDIKIIKKSKKALQKKYNIKIQFGENKYSCVFRKNVAEKFENWLAE